MRKWLLMHNRATPWTGNHYLQIADYVVFGVSLLICLGIGLFYSRSRHKQTTLEEYLMADRELKFFPVALSLLVTYQSGISMLGTPVEVYYYGTQIWMGVLGASLGYTLYAVFIIPVIHPLQLTSCFEYLEMRFSSKLVRIVCSVLGMIQTALYMAIVLYVPALSAETVTGFPLSISLWVLCAITVIYVMMGGLKAVVWTDVFQFVIMISGMLIILVKGTIDVGGIDYVWNISKNGDRLQFFNFDPDPRSRQTFWGLVFGTVFSWMSNAMGQSGFQRICATPNVKEARKAVLINIPVGILYETLVAFLGLVLFAFYTTEQCDPLDSGAINNQNQLVPYYVIEQLSFLPGIPGLFLAAMFSATLSTLSSGLNAITTNIWEDILSHLFPQLTERSATILTRTLVPILGLLVVGLAYMIMNMQGTISQITLSLLTSVSSPVLGVFLLGVLIPWANEKGAIIGGFAALVINGAMSVGSNLVPPTFTPKLSPVSTDGCNATSSIAENILANNTIYNTTSMITLGETTSAFPLFQISFFWYSLIGVLAVLIVGSVFSYITGGRSDDANYSYVIKVLEQRMERQKLKYAGMKAACVTKL